MFSIKDGQFVDNRRVSHLTWESAHPIGILLAMLRYLPSSCHMLLGSVGNSYRMGSFLILLGATGTVSWTLSQFSGVHRYRRYVPILMEFCWLMGSVGG